MNRGLAALFLLTATGCAVAGEPARFNSLDGTPLIAPVFQPPAQPWAKADRIALLG
jgi:hypothetical protein